MEHSLRSAFAMGAQPKANAATAPIAKVLAIVLRVMVVSFAFKNWVSGVKSHNPSLLQILKESAIYRNYTKM
jgi:hypothetical protein